MKPILIALCAAALPGLAVALRTSTPQESVMTTVQHLNPEGLHANPAFSQAIAVRGAHTTLYVGGQNAVDAGGNIVGEGDLGAQAEEVARNVATALAAGGATTADVVKFTVYLVDGQSPAPAYQAFQEVWGPVPKPATISLAIVAGLAHPSFLLEVDAIAVVPEER